MRKNLLILLTVVVGFCFYADNASAKPKTRQQAQKEVEAFLSQRGTSLKVKPSMARGQNEDSQESIYFFDVENDGGYVIVSGSDCGPSILGYTDKGSFDEQDIPENMVSWLEGYKSQIAYMEKTGSVVASRGSSTSHPAIQTMLTTQWGQRYPYNLKCPTKNGKNCVTGCVATAIAQIMYYHRNKSVNKTTKEIPGYYYPSTPDINVYTFSAGSAIDWGNMLNYYFGNETTVHNNAVANLMAYCGAAVKMQYNTGSSGAYDRDVAPGLINYFNYNETMSLEKRATYSDEEWDNLVYSELSKGNPVYYSGRSNEGGHAFVCDGYDGNGYFHINWGWEGSSDGHFLLSALNPYAKGIGDEDSGFNMNQIIIKDMIPKDNSFAGREAYAAVSNGVMTFYYDKDRKTKGNSTYDVLYNSYSPSWNNSLDEVPNITKVSFDKSFSSWQPISTQYWFEKFVNLTSVEGLENLNTSSVSNMYLMFGLCKKLKTIDMSSFNTNKVNDMKYMFYSCGDLTEVKLPTDLKKIDAYMFSGCESLKSVTIPQGVSYIGDHAFWYCYNLNIITSEIQIPFEISSETFPSAIYTSATLKVPDGKKSVYSLTKGWYLFKNIQEPLKPTYSLKYVVDNVVYKTYQLAKGSKITPEAEPTKTGYTFSGWSDIPTIMPAEDVTITGHFFKVDNSAKITIPLEGSTTFCYDLPLDFSVVSDIEAYVVCGYNTLNGNFHLVRVREVPAGIGLMVKGKVGTYTIPVKETQFYIKNMLKPVFTETTVSAKEGNYTNFILINGTFTKLKGSTKLPANSSYLQVPLSLF